MNVAEKKNRKFLIIGIIIVLILVAVLVVFLVFFNKENKEAKLNNLLVELGSEFYTNFYYEQLGETKEDTLKNFTEIGIKVDLDNLSRYNKELNSEKIAEFKNNGNDCDKANTKVVIYPKDPYGKNDFTIDTILVCGFE